MAAIVLKQNKRLEPLHARAAVAEQQVHKPVIVHVREAAAHGAPAAIEADFAVLRRKRAVAVVVINDQRRAVFGTVAGLHGLDHIFVIGPAVLHDVEPAVVVVIDEAAGGANHEIGDAGFGAYVSERAIAVVAE